MEGDDEAGAREPVVAAVVISRMVCAAASFTENVPIGLSAGFICSTSAIVSVA
jgi:hypothetical protein